MRPVILFIATSLDGYIATPDGGIDWLFTDQDYGYAKFYAGVDVVLMGRKTYDQALTFAEYPYENKDSYVFTRTLRGKKDSRVSFVSEDVKKFIARLRSKPGKAIWLVGGAELVHAFMRHGLIDRYVISIHPVVLGNGIPLFKPPVSATKLDFVKCRTFDTGLVQLTYRRT